MYYKSAKPDWIASPVGIAPRPFIAGGLREWPPRGYIGPTTNYRMPALSGCGACGGFGADVPADAFMESSFYGPAIGVGAAAAHGAVEALDSETPAVEDIQSPAGDENWWGDVWSSGSGDGTQDDASYDAYTKEASPSAPTADQPLVKTVLEQTAPAPKVKSTPLWVPVLLGVGLLGLIWWTREKKQAKARARRNAGRWQYYVLRGRGRTPAQKLRSRKRIQLRSRRHATQPRGLPWPEMPPPASRGRLARMSRPVRGRRLAEYELRRRRTR